MNERNSLQGFLNRLLVASPPLPAAFMTQEMTDRWFTQALTQVYNVLGSTAYENTDFFRSDAL
jgi:hypothetical protein